MWVKEVILESISLLGMLGICTIEDIKNRHVEVLLLLAFGILGIVLHVFRMRVDIWDILAGMLLGGILFVISVLSQERIGKGDALMVTISGIYLGFWENLILVWGAMLLAGIVGVFMLCLRSRGKSLPFAPFLTIMYIFILILKGGIVAS